ncbi:sugar transferase [Thioalkalivibrio sp. ALE11]|uniref:sugar transferase n=1 Tax=Thioalkalivibrio sp. ALE11 TaxID=1265494 RepID=UPI0003735F08|nr:sugar transferase [Thioalkalivibrio sp. ALE11]
MAAPDPSILYGSGLSPRQAAIKRAFDIAGALVGLVLTSWLIVVAWFLATLDTRRNGFFTQQRVGRHGRHFRIVKIRTMRHSPTHLTSVTTASDPRVTTLGRFFRRSRIDELPQLWNVLLGQMSFVGPRPDVPGFADVLTGEDAQILALRPGITGPATLKYRDEESLLAAVEDPEAYNYYVIFPDKVRLNRDYVRNWSLRQDLVYLWRTLFE